MAKPIFLDCSYSEKDKVKQLGAKFDWKTKRWFITSDMESQPFAKWLPQQTDLKTDDTLSLNELLLQVQQTISEQHDELYWVRAEVVNLTNHVHIYMELSEHAQDGNEVAKVRATLWNHRAEKLLEHFLTTTGLVFKTGIKVLLQVQIAFHPRYGLSLDVVNIDPNFTLGDMEAKLNKIRKQLQDEGIYTANKELAYANEFCKVAVIAPRQAAGLGDFKSQADKLVGLCEFHYYPASFQGQNAIAEIQAAFKTVVQKKFDAIIMIRGGGAKADLLHLNEYKIAKAICTAPLPVIVGIGHERDKILLDEVANLSCHTPSLVIGHITSTIVQNATNAKQDWQILLQLAAKVLNQAKLDNEQHYNTIREQAINCINLQQLDVLMQDIRNSCKTQLNQATNNIKSLMEQILLGDPKMVLNRGYAIVRNQDNQVITSKQKAEQEKSLVIEFKDGYFVIDDLS
ncbi:exodeoxyribonuclease VII large subunit [Candidatus Halobeggiatoa sp. HSG11]|nr:exodeoxyribonuclease VII large subunit [Candidatus Halobeggiatoa sp. HSG11]